MKAPHIWLHVTGILSPMSEIHEHRLHAMHPPARSTPVSLAWREGRQFRVLRPISQTHFQSSLADVACPEALCWKGRGMCLPTLSRISTHSAPRDTLRAYGRDGIRRLGLSRLVLT